ncbi:MAG TPA: acyl-CoA dehydrogenase family protein [Kofleriaceae bacterium]|nr:acyl-CoA dehydrogenase family protein [Kofleriaceae bacterium]
MRFAFTDEQDELRRMVRRAIASHGGVESARRVMLDDGFDAALWKTLAHELGLAALAIPEAHGGAGLGWVEIVAVAEELGRAVACVPFLSSACLATAAILECASPSQQADLFPAIARGDATATLAWLEVGGAIDPGAIETTARPAPGDHVILSGKKRFVVDGATADLLLVVAKDSGGLGVYAVPAGATGVRRRRLPTMDATRALAEVVLADVRIPASSKLGTAGWPEIARAIARAQVALAAEQVGGAQAALELSVEYAKVRHQFGKPIGSFQAIQHTLAEMFVAVETARSAAYHAAIDFDPISAAATGVYCGDAFYRCAADAIQVHGGIGFTWEHDAHLFFKRARASRTLFGAPNDHRDRVAASLGLGI